MSGWCCETWRDLGRELAELKNVSLDKLLKKGIPRSTFSPVLRILEAIDNFCPLCGNKISTNSVNQQTEKKEVSLVTPATTIESKTPSTIKCPLCRGTGKAGAGLNCMTCLGTGLLDKSNPHRKQFDSAYAEEVASKMEENERRIALVNKEIKDNPKPLREDAKPENWNKL